MESTQEAPTAATAPATAPSGPAQPNPVQKLALEAENRRKLADAAFAEKKFDEAGQIYAGALQLLSKMRGSSVGEMPAIHCLVKQVECCLALDKNDQALAIARIAHTIPSLNSMTPLYVRLFVLMSMALERLEQLEPALLMLDSAIGIVGVEAPAAKFAFNNAPESGEAETFQQLRDRLVSRVQAHNADALNKPIAVGVVPRPIPAPVVESAITHILSGITNLVQKKGEGEASESRDARALETEVKAFIGQVGDMLAQTISLRGNIDARDSKGNNLLWALAKAAFILAENIPKQTAAGDEDQADTKERPCDWVLPLVQLLLQAGAKGDQRFASQQHKTPLQMFAIAGAVRCADALIRSAGPGAVHTYDGQGWTPLVVAVAPNGPYSGNNAPMVELLVTTHKSNVNHATGQGLTALCLCVQTNDLASARICVAAGASLVHRDGMGFTPIVWALIGAHTAQKKPTSSSSVAASGTADECVQFLLKASAHRGQQTHTECAQDARAFRFTKLLAALRLTQQQQQLDAQTLVSSGAGEDDLSKQLLTKLLAALPLTAQQQAEDADGDDNVDGEVPAVSEPVNNNIMLHKIHAALASLVPHVFSKIWQLPSDIPDSLRPQIATLTLAQLINVVVSTSSPVDVAQLRIMMTGPFGPGGRADKPPFLVDYHTLISAHCAGVKKAAAAPAAAAEATAGEGGDGEGAAAPADGEEAPAVVPGREVALVSGLYRDYKELIVDVLATRYSSAIPTQAALSFIANQLAAATTASAKEVTQLVFAVEEEGAESDIHSYWADILASEAQVDAVLENIHHPQNSNSSLDADNLLIVLPDLVRAAGADARGTVITELRAILSRKTNGLVIVVGEVPSDEALTQHAHTATTAAEEDDDDEMPALVDAVDAVNVASSSAPASSDSNSLLSPFKQCVGDVFDQLFLELCSGKFHVTGRHPLPNFIFEKSEVVVFASRK